MEIGRRQWLVALAVAAGMHAGAAVLVLSRTPASGAASAGMGGIEVSLGPAGGHPGSAAPVTEVTPAAAAEAPAVAEAVPVETAAAVADPVSPPAPVPVVQPPVPVETQPVVEPVEEVVAEPVEVAEVTVTPVVTAEPVVPPPTPRVRPVQPRPAQSEPVPAPAAVAAVVAPAVAMPPAQQPETTGTSLPAVGKAGTNVRRDAGSGEASAGGGLPGQTADYMSLLRAWLEKHKEYPRRARQRRIEGTALLYFEMDRQGRVLRYRIQESSGHVLLDHEVEAMIQRAQPLPRMPDDMAGARLELMVPVQFLLR